VRRSNLSKESSSYSVPLGVDAERCWVVDTIPLSAVEATYKFMTGWLVSILLFLSFSVA
jgi:hypothetical protein